MTRRCPQCGLFMTLEGSIMPVVPAHRHLVRMRMWHWGGRRYRRSRHMRLQYRCQRCGLRLWS